MIKPITLSLLLAFGAPQYLFATEANTDKRDDSILPDISLPTIDAEKVIDDFEDSLSQSGAEAEIKQQADVCLSTSVLKADADITVAELRQHCEEKPTGIFKRRAELEKSIVNNPFALIPHKPNYILPMSYSEGSRTPYEGFIDDVTTLDKVEVQFQVSLKYLVMPDLFTPDLNLFVGFTTTSWWQAYNNDSSSPFRETNYEPEVILQYQQPWDLFGLDVVASGLSLNHQSNGQSQGLSRSWNRLIGHVGFEDDNFVWVVRAWWRLPEDQKENPTDSKGDDNPNIERYMGYGDLNGIWKLPNNHSIDITVRNNLRSDNKGAVRLGWTFPLSNHLMGYVQYFNGYGESLIYYDQAISRIGIGFKLTNWL